MSNVETYYLIDFENVNNAGLICSRHLDYRDHIHIFSTKNAPKISIEILSNFHSVDYSFHCLPAGKQSLDMHLTAYLGGSLTLCLPLDFHNPLHYSPLRLIFLSNFYFFSVLFCTLVV